MNSVLNNEFIDEILDSLSRNDNRILICGVNYLGLLLAAKLHQIGLTERVIGFYDPIISSDKIYFNGIRKFELEELDQIKFDEIIITYDKEKEEILKKLNQIQFCNQAIKIFGNKNYDFDDELFRKITTTLHIKSIASGYPEMLIHIYQSILYIEQNNIKGDIVEFGTFKGGTTVFIAKVLKEVDSSRKVYSFDTFIGFPGKKNFFDIFDDEKYGSIDYNSVVQYCRNYNIELVKGDIVDTINKIANTKIALSFFDTDNYSATKIALEKVYPNTPKGGIFAFDHFFSKEWIRTVGERIAAKEVFLNKKVFNLHGTGIFIKVEV